MTKEIERCECCKGRKKILSLGGLEKSCTECAGIGWHEKKTEEKSKESATNEEPVIKKRQGRPKKVA